MKQIRLDIKWDGTNDYCELSDILPWDDIDDIFQKTVKNDGRPPLNSRLVVASLFIQHKEGFKDRQFIQFIKENPYYQMFIGMEEFGFEAPFDASTLVHFRKRIEPLTIEINELILACFEVLNEESNETEAVSAELRHKGDLIIDATVAPVEVRYPTDLKLLDESRITLEKIINNYYEIGSEEKKPRTNRNVAKNEFNKILKQKRIGYNKRKKAV